jgi:hypothetical protein
MSLATQAIQQRIDTMAELLASLPETMPTSQKLAQARLTEAKECLRAVKRVENADLRARAKRQEAIIRDLHESARVDYNRV